MLDLAPGRSGVLFRTEVDTLWPLSRLIGTSCAGMSADLRDLQVPIFSWPEFRLRLDSVHETTSALFSPQMQRLQHFGVRLEMQEPNTSE